MSSKLWPFRDKIVPLQWDYCSVPGNDSKNLKQKKATAFVSNCH